MYVTRTIAASFFALSLSALGSAVYGQQQTEEVIVHGELQKKELLHTSDSISLIDAEELKTRDAKNLEDVLNLAPNVNFATGASRGRFIQIRGIGEDSEFVAPVNPSVGVVMDGIDMTGIATGVTTLDAQQVEIFRGPQGTLYGANALAGMINVVGHAPDADTEFSAAIGTGNYNSYNAKAMFNTALGDGSGWRIAAQKNVSDGFIKDAYLHRHDTNNIDETSVRNALHFGSADKLSADLITWWIDVDNGYDAFSLDNNRTTLSDQPGQDTQKTLANALQLHLNSLSFATLEAVLSRAHSKINYGYDEDWSYRDICPENSACAYWQYSTTDDYQRDNDNTAIDLRLSSKDLSSALRWTLGTYYRKQSVSLLRTYTNNDPDSDFYGPITNPEVTRYNSDYRTDNSALYGQADIDLSERLTLIGGLRYEVRQADFNDSQNSRFSPRDNLWGGKLSLEYTNSADNLDYILLSRGYKAGGFNPDPSLDNDIKLFDPESMINVEVGNKGRWLGGRLQAQTSIFYQWRKDIQVSQSRAYPDNGAFVFVEYLDNAAAGVNYGIENELRWRASEHWTLFSSLGLLRTEYRDFINLSHVDRNEQTGEGYDMSGRDQAHAPHWQYFVAAEYAFGEALSLRVESEGKDAYYFSESHNKKSHSYELLNARLNWDIKNTEISLWIRNIFNKTVDTRGFFFSNDFGNDPRKLYAPETYTQKGAPRTFGVDLNWSY